MTINPELFTVVHIIKQRLQRGFCIDSRVREFIETSCADPDAELILTSADHPDRYMILALLVCPDQEDCLCVEQGLADSALVTADHEKTIADYLSSCFPVISIIFPHDSYKLKIPIDPSIIIDYIAGFKLKHQVDSRILQAINQHIAGELQASVKMQLRQGDIGYSQNKVQALCRYLEHGSRYGGHLSDHFGYFLQFLHQLSSTADVSASLWERKQILTEHLRRIADITGRMESQPMELLLMQGIRLPGRPADSLRQEIILISDIEQFIKQSDFA